MIAADRTRPAPAAARSCSSSMPRGEITPRRRAPRSSISCGPATWWSPTTPRPCPPACAACTCRAAGPIEVRLAGRRSLAPDDVRRSPPSCSARATTARAPRTGRCRRRLRAGDRLALGPLAATVERLLDHPRLVSLRFDGHAGRDLGRPRAARPADPVRARARAAGAVGRVDADRRPAGRVRAALGRLRAGLASARGAAAAAASRSPPSRTRPASRPRATRSWTAGCRSTSRTASRAATAAAIAQARARGGRVVAVGTTVVRALEHAAARDGGCGRARAWRPADRRRRRGLRVVDAILSGTHEPGTSHYELLRAFATTRRWPRADELERHGYRTHEFGDSVLSSGSLARALRSA